MYEMERMKYISKFYRVTCFLLICVFLMFTGNGEAKQKIGELQQSDFGYNGVCLLDTADKLDLWQEKPMFETDMVYDEMRVKRYTYDHDVTVYVSDKDNKIIEITLGGKRYELRNGVKYGTLKTLLMATYGKYVPMKIEGIPCYIYESEKFPGLHFVVELDSDNFFLTGVRLTTLPVEEDKPFRMYTPPDEDPADWDKDYHGVRYNFRVNSKVSN